MSVGADDNVDGEMGVHKTHLVRETVSNSLNHVLDSRSDSPQTSDVLSSSVPDDKLDLVDGGDGLGGRNEDSKGHVNVLNILFSGESNVGGVLIVAAIEGTGE